MVVENFDWNNVFLGSICTSPVVCLWAFGGFIGPIGWLIIFVLTHWLMDLVGWWCVAASMGLRACGLVGLR